MRDWLLDKSSLTKRLQGCCGEGFGVRLITQQRGVPALDERTALRMRLGEMALLRQVFLQQAGCPLVYARTVIPLTSLEGGMRRLRYLGERPLGEVLFNDASMSRGRIEVVRLLPGMALYQQAVADLVAPPEEIWGRRSLFRLAGWPLLVSEFFLPAVLNLK